MAGKSKGPDTAVMGKNNGSPQGDHHLLVISIDEYIHYDKLNNCKNDADSFVQLMQEKYNFTTDFHLYSSNNDEANRKAILTTLKGH